MAAKARHQFAPTVQEIEADVLTEVIIIFIAFSFICMKVTLLRDVLRDLFNE